MTITGIDIVACKILLFAVHSPHVRGLLYILCFCLLCSSYSNWFLSSLVGEDTEDADLGFLSPTSSSLKSTEDADLEVLTPTSSKSDVWQCFDTLH